MSEKPYYEDQQFDTISRRSRRERRRERRRGSGKGGGVVEFLVILLVSFVLVFVFQSVEGGPLPPQQNPIARAIDQFKALLGLEKPSRAVPREDLIKRVVG